LVEIMIKLSLLLVLCIIKSSHAKAFVKRHDGKRRGEATSFCSEQRFSPLLLQCACSSGLREKDGDNSGDNHHDDDDGQYCSHHDDAKKTKQERAKERQEYNQQESPQNHLPNFDLLALEQLDNDEHQEAQEHKLAKVTHAITSFHAEISSESKCLRLKKAPTMIGSL
jgi:hypothetical protein